ncbi:MAG: hypothetical protein ACJ768_09325 [Gaiellaceae bacterium]
MTPLPSRDSSPLEPGMSESDVLAEVHRLWREDHAALEVKIGRLREALTAFMAYPVPGELRLAEVRKLAREALRDAA